MKYLKERLYLSTFVNSFGSWLTFLAIALIVKDRYGGQQVAWVFLVQTLPAILFSRGLSELVPKQKQEKYYLNLQVALALNSLVLCFNQSLPVLYAHLFLAALLKAVSGPLFNTLVGKWFSVEKLRETFTRVGSIQTSTLALAPIAGAWIKIASSAEILFLVDALSFILSALLLLDILRSPSAAEEAEVRKLSLKSLCGRVASLPANIPKELWKNLLLWFGFLVIGALLNALEFSKFEHLHMTETMIGYALAAWGGGSLLAFMKKLDKSSALIFLIFILSLGLFLVTSLPWIAIMAFASAGWTSTLVSGVLRADIQASVPAGYNALPVWAFANQVTQVINLVAYAGIGLLLGVLGLKAFAVVTMGLGLLMQVNLMRPKQIFIWKQRTGALSGNA